MSIILLDLIDRRCPGDRKRFAEEIKANNPKSGKLSDKKLADTLHYLKDEGWFL